MYVPLFILRYTIKKIKWINRTYMSDVHKQQ